MKRILLSLCLLLIMCAPWTMGQQVMTPQYSTYTSFSTDSSGVITTTVTVQGTTQINPSCTYCYSAWHSPKTVNQFTRTDTGAVLAGGLTSGPGVQPPSQQINYTSTTTFNPLDYSDQDWTWTSTTSSQVFCSVVGQIYAGGTGGFQAGTPSQHAYTQNPLPSNCRISQYYELYEIIEHIMPRMSFLMTVGAVELGLSMNSSVRSGIWYCNGGSIWSGSFATTVPTVRRDGGTGKLRKGSGFRWILYYLFSCHSNREHQSAGHAGSANRGSRRLRMSKWCSFTYGAQRPQRAFR